ncbi:MAG TPA: hypothetical protein DCL44_03400 [Elusimicrobia bacterium]|nr:hypothetical protein [Elusimicrobiota bacterium]
MIIEIFTKGKYAKNEEAGFAKKLVLAGLKTNFLKVSKLYLIEGVYSGAEISRLACELLLDPITEDWLLKPRRCVGDNIYRVEIWLKNSVTDVVGQSVKEAVADMGLKGPKRCRFGRCLYVRASSELKLKHAVAKTLMNETVNYCEIIKV